MGLKRTDLYNSRVQLDFGFPGGLTYYVNGVATCLGQRKNDENTHEYCSLSSGTGTGNEGTGRCKFHGGSSLARPTTGRYSVIAKGQLKEQYEEFIRDPNMLDLVPELSIQRVALSEAIKRYESTKDPVDLELMLKTSQMIVGTTTKIENIQSQKVMTVASARLMMVKAVETMRKILTQWFPDAPDEEINRKLEQFMETWKEDVQGE